MATSHFFFFFSPLTTPAPPAGAPGTPLFLKRYPVRRASDVENDSSVTGSTVKDALDELQTEIDGIGGGGGADFVSGPLPAASTNNAAMVWDGTGGRTARDSSVIFHPVTTLDAIDLDKPEFQAWFETLETAVVDTGVVTFDLDKANVWKTVLNGDHDLTLDQASISQLITLVILQDGTGGRTPNWTNTIQWDKDRPPVLSPLANGIDVIVLRPIADDGYGVISYIEVSRMTSAPRKDVWPATDAATVTFDLRISRKQKVILGGARTLALVGVEDGQPFYLKLIQDGTGGRIVTWFSTIHWAGNVAPTLSSDPGDADWFAFIPVDGDYDGFILGQEFTT